MKIQTNDDSSVPTELKKAELKHAPVTTCRGVRCIWCNRVAKDRAGLNKVPCVQAPNHTLWRSGSTVMCSNCGSYSSERTQKLKVECRADPNSFAKARMHKFFELHRHPTSNVAIPPAVLAQIGYRRQVAEYEEETESLINNGARPSGTSSFNDPGDVARFGPKGDFKLFQFPAPDEVRFRLAVLGRSLAEDRVGIDVPKAPQASTNRCIGASSDGKDASA